MCVCWFISHIEVLGRSTQSHTEVPKNSEVLFPRPRYVYLAKCWDNPYYTLSTRFNKYLVILLLHMFVWSSVTPHTTHSTFVNCSDPQWLLAGGSRWHFIDNDLQLYKLFLITSKLKYCCMIIDVFFILFINFEEIVS